VFKRGFCNRIRYVRESLTATLFLREISEYGVISLTKILPLHSDPDPDSVITKASLCIIIRVRELIDDVSWHLCNGGITHASIVVDAQIDFS
jgi:hypothetical protein